MNKTEHNESLVTPMIASIDIQEYLTLKQSHADLLAALRDVQQWNEVSGIDDEWPVVMEQVSAAIAKATT